MSTRKRSGEIVVRAERRQRAVQLRRQGRSYREIAAELGVAVGQAHDDVKRTLDALPKPDAELHRRESLERLDAAVGGVWPAVAAGDPKAVYALVQVEARRAALLGLDMPARSEIAIENIETRRRVQLVAEIEAASDGDLSERVFESLEHTVAQALADDEERAFNVLAKCGLVAGWASPNRRLHRHERST